MITDVAGIEVGHWTDDRARTGCTVVVFPPGTVGSGEVRGGAPATRDFALLDPIRTVGQVDAVVLTGGSAFGLASVDGVLAELEARGRGFPTAAGPVPIVIGLGLFDLMVGDPSVRPGPDQGRMALIGAEPGPHRVGPVGAGTGATVAKWTGEPRPGGLGAATVGTGPVLVSALVAVNAFGAIDQLRSDPDPGPDPDPDPGPPRRRSGLGSDRPPPDPVGTNTTIGVVATNVALDKLGCHLLAQSAHDGFARALIPAHTPADGDAMVAVATGEVDGATVDPFHLRVLAQIATARAIRSVAGPQ